MTVDFGSPASLAKNLRCADTIPAVSIIGDAGGARALAQGCELAWTPCHFGGLRPWLVCPRCRRRCVKLYPLRNSERAWCRRCLRLRYSLQRVGWCGRRVRKAQRIRARLGGSTDLSSAFPRRAKWMHRTTYLRLRREGLELEAHIVDVENLRELRRFVGRRSSGPFFPPEFIGARIRERLAEARRLPILHRQR